MRDRSAHRAIAVDALSERAIRVLNVLQLALFGFAGLCYLAFAFTQNETWLLATAVLGFIALSVLIVRAMIGLGSLAVVVAMLRR